MGFIKNKKGTVLSINISKKKGTTKQPVGQARLIKGSGIQGDVHAGLDEKRQVSLLAFESIKKMTTCPKVKKKGIDLKPGDFAENITTKNINLASLKLGDKIKIGSDVILEISKIGKECHSYCEIFKKLGDCIMPREGIFGRVLQQGVIKINDPIKIIN